MIIIINCFSCGTGAVNTMIIIQYTTVTLSSYRVMSFVLDLASLHASLFDWVALLIKVIYVLVLIQTNISK